MNAASVWLAAAGRGNIPASTPFTLNVQASTGAQAYAVASRNIGQALDLDFEGGWQNVNTTPVQSGVSMVMDAATNKAGISLTGASHSDWRRIVIDRFAFTNVTRGVEVLTDGGADGADILVAVSNTTVCAQTDGIFLWMTGGIVLVRVHDYPRLAARNGTRRDAAARGNPIPLVVHAGILREAAVNQRIGVCECRHELLHVLQELIRQQQNRCLIPVCRLQCRAHQSITLPSALPHAPVFGTLWQ